MWIALYLCPDFLFCKNPSHAKSEPPLRTAFYFSRSVVSDSATPRTAARQASLSITTSQSLLKLMSIESMMPSNHLILCHHLLLPPSVFPSVRVFSKESALIGTVLTKHQVTIFTYLPLYILSSNAVTFSESGH